MSFFGFNGIAELTPQVIHDPRNGWQLQRRWRGTPTQIVAQQSVLIAAGIRTQREEHISGGYQEIIGVYGAEETQDPDEPLADLWDLLGNDLEKSIWLAPKVRSVTDKMFIVPALPALPEAKDDQLAALARFRADVEALARGETVTFDSATGEEKPAPLTLTYLMAQMKTWNAAFAWGLTDPDFRTLRRLVRDLSLGIDQFVLSQYVLRRSTVIVRGSNIRPSTANINRFYTSTPAMELAEGVPALPFDLPNGMWLKKTPSRTQTGPDKWTINQEWWHADTWSDLGYDEANV